MDRLIKAAILTGVGKGEDVQIPRFQLIPTDVAFQFKQIQFPIRLSFAMSINKAQSQSLHVAGLHVTSPCFSHGQLYVACSRVGSLHNLYTDAPQGVTQNVVYSKVLSG